MGKYYLNGVDLSRFGFIPGQAQGSNIALSGAWSLPPRLGDCYYEWPEGVEPFVSDGDICLGGRDLALYGTIIGKNRDEFLMNLNELYGALHQFNDLVELKSDDFGCYKVYVKDVIKTTYLRDGFGNIVLKFREPAVDIAGILPVGTSDVGNRIDDIPLSELGLTMQEFSGRDNRPAIQTMNFNAWQREGYQVTKPKVREFNLRMGINAVDYTDFRQKVGQYYQLFSSPGVRDVTVHGETEALFCKDGFTIENILIQDSVTATLNIKMLDGYILNQHILCDDDTNIAIGENDSLIIAYG